VRAACLALLGSIAWLLTAGPASAGGWRESSLAVDGVERWYRVYLPTALPPDAPVILSLHGGTGSMYTIDRGPTRGWVKLAERERLLLVVPNGTQPATGDGYGLRQNWNDLRRPADSGSGADDVRFLRVLLDRIQTDYGTDRNRVYVTGNSNGGMMAYRLLIEAPERFAAAAVFVASIPVFASPLRPPTRPVPLMMWFGTDDRMMKYDGGEIPGRRGLMRSAPDSVSWWLRANRAIAGQAATAPVPDTAPDDGCRILRTSYPAGHGGAPVLVYLAEGGGHAMPSRTETSSEGGPLYRMLVGRTCRDVEGADLAWDFMRGFSLEP
jgi:polyhydroxybutyrate depolymerase